MKSIVALIISIIITSSIVAQDVQDGDIIFNISNSSQSIAIEKATHSKYSHTGIIFFKDTIPFVLEAVQPVRYTKLSKWIKLGRKNHYVVKRLKNRDSLLTQETIKEMKRVGENFLHNDYDIYFNWSDKELYCSELVWKVFKRGGDIELCNLHKLKEYDLTHSEVSRLMKKRYGENPPLEEFMVSPQDIFESDLLIEVINKK